MSTINNFQTRFAFVNADGTLTPEASRMLREWFSRIGGTSSHDVSTIADLLADLTISVNDDKINLSFDDSAAQIAELKKAVDELRDLIPASSANAHLISRIDDLDHRIALINVPPFPSPGPFIAPILLNSWVNNGGGYNDAGYYKDAFGVVHLRGLIKDGTVTASAFLLPSDCRPKTQEAFATMANDAFARVDVLADGNVTPKVGSNAFFSLDGITFKAQ
jgi:tetrahydromethanopterin S-methyltransferase subunit B